jgi:hypothetical protein
MRAHVEEYEISDKLSNFLPVPDEDNGLHYVLKLGPSFKPNHEVWNGDIWPNGRVWFDIDTVFVCETGKDAIELSKQIIQ